MIAFLLSHVGVVMGFLGSMVILISGAFFGGTLSGANKERNKTAQDNLKAVQNKKAVDDDVAALDTNSLAGRFNRWMRNDK